MGAYRREHGGIQREHSRELRKWEARCREYRDESTSVSTERSSMVYHKHTGSTERSSMVYLSLGQEAHREDEL